MEYKNSRLKPTPQSDRDIFTRDLDGELVDMNDSEFEKIFAVIQNR